MGHINDIFVDYEKGILLVNGRKVECPVRIVVKGDDGWDISKIINMDGSTTRFAYPEIVIDVRKFFDEMERQKMKDIFRELMEEFLPEKNQGACNPPS